MFTSSHMTFHSDDVAKSSSDCGLRSLRSNWFRVQPESNRSLQKLQKVLIICFRPVSNFGRELSTYCACIFLHGTCSVRQPPSTKNRCVEDMICRRRCTRRVPL